MEEHVIIKQTITNIQNDMQNVLDEKQMKMLSESLLKHLSPLETDGAAQNQEKNRDAAAFPSS